MYLCLFFIFAPLWLFFFVLQPLYNVFLTYCFCNVSGLFFFLSIAATLVILLTVFNCGFYFVVKLYTNFFSLHFMS